MTPISSLRSLTAAIGCALLMMGCQTAPGSSPASSSSSTQQAPAADTGAGTSSADDTPAKTKDAGEAQVVGKPAANSKFTKLKMGMGMKEVTDLIGPPTDQGAYITGKAWIPFYFGPDRYRHELLYKGQGRLVFAGGGLGNLNSGRLTRIIHNADERGYR
jgi:hypothetical protein